MFITSKRIVLFDGPCNLCNWAVSFIIKRDPQKKFLFCPLDSTKGREITQKLEIDISQNESLIFVENSHYQTRSAAVFAILKELKFPWNLFYPGIFIPQFLRDGVYNLIARNRYRFFGKKEGCPIAEKEDKERFI